MQPTCDEIDCMCSYANKTLKKHQENQGKARRKALKQFNDSDISVLKRKAQKAVNEFIRKRDEHLPCISCGYDFNQNEPRQRHAGHYKPQGGNSLLRFHEDNIHAQCSICNNHKSGNLAEYRKNLIKKIGLEKVEWLESANDPKRWSKEELQDIITKYKHLLKEHKQQGILID